VVAKVLVVRSAGRRCGIPIEAVAEVTRALATTEVAGQPAYVRGTSFHRGEPVLVLDLAGLFGEPPPGATRRWVALRVDQRRVALAVEQVEGVRDVDAASLAAMPGLMAGAGPHVAALALHDRRLVWMLDTARLLEEGPHAGRPA
jgi:purine-binding chemotaxis protein CheW